MSIAIILVTHENIARNLLDITASIISDRLENTDYVEVPMNASVEQIEFKIDEKLAGLDQDEGLLIVTDCYGSTPSNIATSFSKQNNTRMVSGVNLPMLVRIMNYRTLALDELTEIAIKGGHDGIALYEERAV